MSVAGALIGALEAILEVDVGLLLAGGIGFLAVAYLKDKLFKKD